MPNKILPGILPDQQIGLAQLNRRVSFCKRLDANNLYLALVCDTVPLPIL